MMTSIKQGKRASKGALEEAGGASGVAETKSILEAAGIA